MYSARGWNPTSTSKAELAQQRGPRARATPPASSPCCGHTHIRSVEPPRPGYFMPWKEGWTSGPKSFDKVPAGLVDGAAITEWPILSISHPASPTSFVWKRTRYSTLLRPKISLSTRSDVYAMSPKLLCPINLLPRDSLLSPPDLWYDVDYPGGSAPFNDHMSE